MRKYFYIFNKVEPDPTPQLWPNSQQQLPVVSRNGESLMYNGVLYTANTSMVSDYINVKYIKYNSIFYETILKRINKVLFLSPLLHQL